MRYKLTSIEPFHLGWFAGLVISGITFVMCACIGLVVLVMESVQPGMSRPVALLPLFAMVFVLPILYGVFGVLAGYVVARVFNLAAKRLGGIDVTLERRDCAEN
jgi:predicted branched-subunit amino acid permease